MNLSGGDGFSLPASMGGFPQLQQDHSHAPNPTNPKPNPPNPKRRRNQPGTPDPDAEVMALSPKTLMATNRFVCEICNKGFQRDQNLQLHRRGHNLPWKLRQRSSKEQARKKVYICPEETCVHHHPSRALGDLTGIKKHFSRKHGEKKWKCDKCSKKYAVQSDWKAHSKTCGTREYKCDCGTLFSRKDSFITHRAFCDALVEDTAARASPPPATLTFKTDSNPLLPHGFATLQAFQDPNSLMFNPIFPNDFSASLSAPETAQMATGNVFNSNFGMMSNNQQLQHHSLGGLKEESSIHSVNTKKLETLGGTFYTSTTTDNNQSSNSPPAPMSATALLQRAAQMGSTRSSSASSLFANSFGAMNTSSGFHPISSSNDSNYHGNINPYQQQQHQVMMQPMASNQNESSFSAALMSSSSAAMHMGNQLDQLMSTGARSCPTRDFLGVGSGYPFSPLELAGFAHFANTKGL